MSLDVAAAERLLAELFRLMTSRGGSASSGAAILCEYARLCGFSAHPSIF